LKELIDISIPLKTGMVCWPGSPGFTLTRIMDMEMGDVANGSQINTDVHIGTHIDAPWHSIPNGATIEQLPIDVLIGPAYVLRLPDVSEITGDILRKTNIPKGTERLLFHTRNSSIWNSNEMEFRKDFVALTLDGAEWISKNDIKLVGIDYLSIQPFGESMEIHNVMLKKGIVIVEGLNLSGVEQGNYELICLPLRLVGAEGSPARAVLRRI